MSALVPPEVLEAFSDDTPGLPPGATGAITVQALGGGLINESYQVNRGPEPDYFLQRINTEVFTDPRAVQANYIRIWQYAEFEFTGLRLPAPIYIDNHTSLFRDREGGYWRAFEFIGDSKTVDRALRPAQAKSVARTFAKFTAAFGHFNVGLLRETIPGFHDLGLRFRQFETSLQGEAYERMAQALPLIRELQQRERYVHFYEVITGSDAFPLRVVHHDAKIGNILFHKKTGRVICPVDYDTVMPGYFFSDPGDMIRSMAGSTGENSRDPDAIRIRPDFYKAIMEGYLEVLGPQLTDAEKKYFHSAGLLIIYMQALRFLTDYLSGDTYYRIAYPEQNLDRARNQFSLLMQLEQYLRASYAFHI